MEGKSDERRGILEDGSVLVLHADLLETKKEYIIFAELPGVEKEKAEIKLTDVGIQICGECKCDRKYSEIGAKFVKRELLHTRACRYIAFPIRVSPERAEARLDNGLLEVKVPKAEKSPERAAGNVIHPPMRIPVA